MTLEEAELIDRMALLWEQYKGRSPLPPHRSRLDALIKWQWLKEELDALRARRT